jgi:hypothetical protein
MKKTAIRRVAMACMLWLGFPLAAQETRLPPKPKDLDAALLATPIAAAVEAGNKLEVVDQATDLPIAGAEVFVIDDAATKAVRKPLRELQQTFAQDPDAFFRLLAHWYGTRYQTGADGTVSIAAVDRGTVVAFAGNRFASVAFRRWPSDVLVLKLTEQQYLEVLVKDSKGRPAADVPVDFGVTYDQGSHGAYFLSSCEGITDGTGRFRVPRSRVPDLGAVVVQAEVLTAEPLRTKLEFDANGHQSAPAELKLPPCGMVRVLLYDEHEKPIDKIHSATLRGAPGQDLGGFAVRPSKLEPDSAFFRWVALDLQLQALVTSKDFEGALTHEQAGPTRAGELVVCGVRMAVGKPILRLRALDVAGKPLAETTLGFVLARAHSFDGNEVKTDAEGRLQLTVDLEGEDAADGQVLLIARGLGTKRTAYRGAWRLPLQSIQPGVNELGDIRFVEEPPMVSGIVVSSDGKPVAGAVVATQLSHMHSSHSTSVSNSGTALFFSHAVATDAEGRFTLRELGPKDTPLQLHLNSDSLVLTEAITATPGDTAITLRAVQAGTASLTLAEPAYGEILTVYLERDGNRETSSYGRWRSGRFEWTGLVPGKYVLKATTTDQAVELLRDLEVSSNAACTDARLQNFEMKDHLRIVKVTVRGPGQAPLEDFQVTCVHLRANGGGGNAHGASTQEDGTVRLVMPRQDNTLWFTHADYRTARLEQPTEDVTVDLVLRANVRLRLPDAIKLPDGVRIVVEPTENLWWAESAVKCATLWNNTNAVIVHPDRDGELNITVQDPAGNRLWQDKVTVPQGTDVEVTVPLDATAAADIAREYGEKR